MLSQSMGSLWLPDYSINRRWTLMNFARVDEFLNRSAATGGCFCCCLTQSCCSGTTLLSQAVNELITDSHKSTQVQYNRARPFIILILTSNTFSCSNNVVKPPENAQNRLIKQCRYCIITLFLQLFLINVCLINHISSRSSLFWVWATFNTPRERVQQPHNLSRQLPPLSPSQSRVFKQAIKMNYYQTHAETQPPFSPGIGESRMKM